MKVEDAPPAEAGARGGREEGRSTILRRSRSREMVKRAGLGLRARTRPRRGGAGPSRARLDRTAQLDTHAITIFRTGKIRWMAYD
ncbi:hypothetical protein NL676_001922 [Syzygium grande]|nr:hypothetical protein NL676_001922 [Syzygium grande]